MNGIIFDIKEFSIHDGPGCRVTVFLKGCPLRCRWCHNPEGLSTARQLMVKKNLCTHCGSCKERCDHPECEPFDRCLHRCPNGCITVTGETVTSDELAAKLNTYRGFIESTGGGITISGGEPLLQHEFVCELADKLNGMHLAIQTSGYADADVYRKTIESFDFIMQDIKLADDEVHRRYTGMSNEKILKNIKYLQNSGKEYVLRIPLIPSITDTPENLARISEIAGDSPVELLRYNEMAGAKYEMLGYDFLLAADISNADEDYTRYFKNAILR